MAESNEKNLNQDSPEEQIKNDEPAEVKNEKPKSVNVAEFDELDESHTTGKDSMDKFELLKELQLNVFIELGRTQMYIKDILELERGYVIELDKLASEPVDIYINNRKIAEGEVVVIDKHFGIRITNLSETQNRIKGI